MQTSPRLPIRHEFHPECYGSRVCNRDDHALCTKSLETQRLFVNEREAIHRKTFKKWMNNKLSRADKPVQVKDLIEDLRDGHVLLTLLETLLSTKLPREKGKMRLHKLTNVRIVFEQLEKNGVKIVGINNGDIVDGIPRPILGLVWSIILRFQVHELFQEESSGAKVKDFHVEKRLLSWCQDVLDGYEDVIKLKDFTVGWRNGLAFNAIIHSHKPELFEFDDLLDNDNKTNLQHAFTVAQDEFDVDALLEPGDIDVPQPDKKLIMMYLTSMYDVLKDYEPTRERRNKKLQLKKDLEAYRAAHSEITLYMTQVESIVLTKLDSDERQADPADEHQIAKDLTRDTANHVTDVNDVKHKGQKLIDDGKISQNDQQEIKTQIEALEIRWEKLLILVSRLSKRCQTALVAPKQRKVEYYVTWVRQTSRDVQLKGNATTPEETRQELQDIEEIVADIDENEPGLNLAVQEAEAISQDESIYEDVKQGLQNQLDVLVNDWERLKKATLEKQKRLQQAVGSEPLVDVKDVGVVESAPAQAFEIQVRRINVKSPPASPRLVKHDQVEKLQTWKRKHDEARDVINEFKMNVKKLKLEDESSKFNEQYEICNQKLQKANPVVDDTIKYGQDVIEDQSIDEDQRDVVSQELETLVADFDDFMMQLDEAKMDESAQHDQSKVKEDIDVWKTSRDELRPKISDCHVMLKKAKQKPIPYKRDCEQEVTQLEPEVSAFLDDGNRLLQNTQMTDSDKELVAMNMHEIDNQFITIKQETYELKNKVDEVIHDEEAKKDEQLYQWKDLRDDLKPKISNQFVVLKELKAKQIPLERVDVIMRVEEVEACHQDVTSLDPEVSRFIDKSNELIQSDNLDDQEKSLVTKDMKDVDEEYEELRSGSKELRNEVEKWAEKLDKKSFDLEKWRDWKRSISSKLDSIEDTVNDIKSIETSRNLETLEDSLALSEKSIQDLENLEPEVVSALEFGQLTKNDSPLSEEEKQEITNDMEQMNSRLKALKEDASNQNEWLKVYLEEQETTKTDALEKWQNTKQITSALIDNCQSKVNALNDNPETKEEIESEIAKVQEYAEEVPLIFQEVQSCFDQGNTLLADDLLAQNEKDLVQSDAEEIGNKLRALQNDVEMHQKRLQGQLTRKTAADEQEAMRYSKLSKWERTKHGMKDTLDDFRRKFRLLLSQPLPKNAAETGQRIKSTADISDEIMGKIPEVQSGYEYGNELLNDDELTEVDKDNIEIDMSDLRNGFQNLRDDVNYEHKRLTDLLEEFRAEDNKMASWKDETIKLNRLLEEARKIVKDLKSRPEPITADEIDDQIDETQEVYQQMASEAIPDIDAGLSMGNELLKDPRVSDPNKDIVEHDLNILEPAFKETREEFTNYFAWLQALTPEETVTVNEDQTLESEPEQTDGGDPGEERFVVRRHVTADQYFKILHDAMTPEERYEHERQEKLHQWKNIIDRIDELLNRLMEKLNRLKSTDPERYDDIKDHKETAEDCIEEIQGSEPMIRESIRLGNELLDDKNVDEDEKERIRVYIRSLNIKLKTIQDEADQEQQRADKLIEEKYHPNTDEEPIVEEEPINEQFAERGGDWDWSNLDEQREKVPHSPLRINSVDQSINIKFFEKGPQKEYVMSIEDKSTDNERRDTEEKLNRWRHWKNKLDDFLRNVQDRMDKVDGYPNDKDDLDKKLQEVKDCKKDIENYEPDVVSALDCANDVLKDKDIDEQQKVQIKAYISDLEVQLKTVHRQVVNEQHRLERLQNEYNRELVDEKFHVTHHDRPYWELNFSDGEEEDEIIHSMFERGLPHDYFDNLHDDMSPEERRIAEKDKKMRDWQNWRNKLDELIARLSDKLNRVKSTDEPTDWRTVKEHKDEAEDCKEEIEESEPMIREAFHHCDDLLDDPYLTAEEKQEIEDYVSHAQVKLRNLHKDAVDEEERLTTIWNNTPHPRYVTDDHEQIIKEQPIHQQFSQRKGFDFEFEDEHVNEEVEKEHKVRGEFDLHFDEVEDSHEGKDDQRAHTYITILLDDLTPEQRDEAKKAEKLENWRKWQNRLDTFLERQRKQLDYVADSDPPPERKAIQEILDEATECKEEIEDSKPRVMHAVEYANELLQDDDITEKEKEEIKQYIKELEAKLQDMYNEACDEEDRLSEMLENLPRDKDDEDKKQSVYEELHYARHHERPDFELHFDDDKDGHSDEVIHAMFVPSKPINDYIWDLHDDLDLDQRHEAEKRDQLGKWRNWKDYLDDMVLHLNRRLHRVQEVPKDRNDVIEQRDEAKELQEDVEDSKPTLRKAIDCANDVLARDDVTDEEKDDVKNYVEQLTTQLRKIRDDAANEERKLDRLLDEMPAETKQDRKLIDEFLGKETKERPYWELSFNDEVDGNRKSRLDKERDQKMDVWFEHRDRLNKISETGRHDVLEITTRPTPTNEEQLNDQISRTEDLIQKLAEIMPVLRQSFSYGNELLADEDIPEKDKDDIEDDMQRIRDELSSSKKEVEDHYQKLKELREEMSTAILIETVEEVQAEPEMDDENQRKQAEKEEKFSRWRKSQDNLNDLLDQLKAKLMKVKSGDTPHNRREIKDKINEIKICKEGVDALDPEVNETLARAEDILNDDDIDIEEKQLIRRDINDLKSRRIALRNQCDDENNRLGIELSQLDTEKSEKFSKWRKWRELVRDLLDNFNGKLNKVKNSKTPTNRKSIEEQLSVLRECENGLQSSNPEIQFALEYGRHLSEDDLLDDNEQKTVRQETSKFEKDLNNIKVDVEKEKERLNEALEKHEAVLREKLSRWNDKKRSVRPSFDKLQNKVGVLKFKLKPRNKQEILERLDEVEECKAELNQVEPNIQSCIDHGEELLREKNLDKGSTETVKDDLDEFKGDLKKLKQDIADQQVTLKKLSDEEDLIKKEKQHKYRDLRKEIQNHVQKLKDKLKRLPKSNDEAHKHEASKDELMDQSKECSRDLDKLDEEVRDLRDYGNGLIDDGNLDDKEIREVKDDVARLQDELDDIRTDNNDIKLTIAEMNEQQPSVEDHPDMEEWRERVKKVQIGLEVAEDRLFDTTDLNTRAEIKERLDEIKELNIGFEETEPQFVETIDRGKELLEKEDIPDNNKEEISVDLISMSKQWGNLKSDGLAKEESLEGLLLSTAEQTDELVGWHERCDDMQAWVDDTLSLLETRPLTISASFGTIKRQQTVTEEILEDLVNKQPQVNDIIDDGNRLLDDPSCGTDERKDVHDKMSKLYADWDRLSLALTSRQEHIQDSIVKLEQQHKDLEEIWRKKYGPLRKWITGAQARLNKEYAIAPDLDSVKKQRKDIENFRAEKDSHAPEVNEITQMSENILKGPQVNEEEKTIIQDEMQELEHGWNELDESLVWKQNRIEDTIRKLENQREDKLRKWQEGLDDVNPWITKTLNNIKPEPTLANDVDSAYDQIDEFQNHVRDAPIYQDKVTNLNEFSSNLLADPCLGEDERQKVRKEMAECNEKWNELVNIANSRQSKLDDNLAKLEKQQNDDFNRWTTRVDRASELLGKFEAELPRVDKPLATQLEDVEKQEQEFDVFANHVELNETQIQDTFDLGESIVNDTKNAKSKRDGVQGQLNLLTSRWDRIKDFVDLRKARLEETAKRLRENRKRKIEKWEETTNEFDLFLSAAERDIRSSDSIGDDLPTVKRHNEEFKDVMSKVRSQKRKVFEYGQYTDKVIDDPQLDAVSRDHIKIEKEARIDRWGHIEDMINSHQAKLRDKLLELEKGHAEMDGWNNRLNNVNSKIANLERANEIPIGRDQDTIEKQRQDIKALNLEKDAIDDQVSNFLSYSEELMDKPGINTENRRHINKQCDALELRWHKAKGDLERREKSLEEKQDSLNRRQKNLLSDWDTRKSEVSDWLTDTSTKLKELDANVSNVDAAKDQTLKLQHIRKDVTGYEKHVRTLEDFADTLIMEPGIHSSEKALVTREKQAIRERWESLNTATHNVQKKLGSRIDDLEGEQTRRLNDWRRQSQPLDSWLNETETEVEAYEPIAYDIPMVERQQRENQSTMKDIEQKKPQFDELDNFANVLKNETFIGLEEKVKIQDDMESLQERFENVDDAVTKRQAE
ncbi:dystrophin isoform X2 [Exaiptasia diaphana]|uniref:Calponin-homology (CH) domain-containing protein n=1 Tax=Exaiptasia diaphana TaxID=2652724 RepID=A0A913Y0Q4_EXADI|nr:dystrophin isoform X2 [Exaiptasia diaphana]